MKKPYKIYLTEEEHQRLLAKAEEMGFIGRAALSHFLSKLAFEKIILADSNLKKFLELVNFKTEPKQPLKNKLKP